MDRYSTKKILFGHIMRGGFDGIKKKWTLSLSGNISQARMEKILMGSRQKSDSIWWHKMTWCRKWLNAHIMNVVQHRCGGAWRIDAPIFEVELSEKNEAKQW